MYFVVKIKQEFQETNVLDNYDVGQNGALAQDLKNYELPSNVKFNMDDEKPRKLWVCGICNKGFKDNYRLRRHESQVHTKDWNLIQPDQVFEPKTKIETQDAQDFKDEEQFDFEYTDVDLSDEFLSEILRLVDELCDVINRSDPDLYRTVKVNNIINEASKIKLDV